MTKKIIISYNLQLTETLNCENSSGGHSGAQDSIPAPDQGTAVISLL